MGLLKVWRMNNFKVVKVSGWLNQAPPSSGSNIGHPFSSRAIYFLAGFMLLPHHFLWITSLTEHAGSKLQL